MKLTTQDLLRIDILNGGDVSTACVLAGFTLKLRWVVISLDSHYIQPQNANTVPIFFIIIESISSSNNTREPPRKPVEKFEINSRLEMTLSCTIAPAVSQ